LTQAVGWERFLSGFGQLAAVNNESQDREPGEEEKEPKLSRHDDLEKY